MANPLQSAMPPDAPLPNAGPVQAQNEQLAPLQSALSSSPQQQPSPLQTPQGPPPAPTHEQTVCALRHFAAIQTELEELLRNPKLGKADIKSAIIDGTTKLVADRIISPAQAVTQLGTVPDKPFDQRQWLMQHYMMAKQAENQILDHHAQGNPGSLEWSQEAPRSVSNIGDRHLDLMGDVMSHYKGARRGR